MEICRNICEKNGKKNPKHFTLDLRSLSAGVSVQMERSLFSGPDFFLKVRAPKPMCCSSGGSSVIQDSRTGTSGASCKYRKQTRN